MKQIGIVTYHKVRNYGSVLQSYALMRVLQKKGYDAQIINYIPFPHSTKEEYFGAPNVNISIKDNINMIETDSEFAKKVNSVLCCCNKENEKRSEFFQEYSVNGYEKAIKKYCRIGVVNKILTQTGLKPLIRKILGR